jgi:AcrR family transcriptional regulator
MARALGRSRSLGVRLSSASSASSSLDAVVQDIMLNSDPVGSSPVPQLRLDRRTRGRQRRRDQVYEAAIELIVSRGFDNTTMDDIAERADVARATVFNHFERKAAIIEEWGSRRRQRALAAVHADLSEHSIRQVLETCMVELANVSTSARPETVALMTAAVHSTNVLGHPALADEFAAFLARARAEGQIPDGTDPDLGGLLLATGYFAVLTAWIEVEPPPFDLRVRLLDMLDMVLDGLNPTRSQPAQREATRSSRRLPRSPGRHAAD